MKRHARFASCPLRIRRLGLLLTIASLLLCTLEAVAIVEDSGSEVRAASTAGG